MQANKNDLQCLTCTNDQDTVCNGTVQCVGIQDRCITVNGEYSCCILIQSCGLVKQRCFHPQGKLTSMTHFWSVAVHLQTYVKFCLTWKSDLLSPPTLLTSPVHLNVVEPASVIQPGLSDWVFVLCCLVSFPWLSIRTNKQNTPLYKYRISCQFIKYT